MQSDSSRSYNSGTTLIFPSLHISAGKLNIAGGVPPLHGPIALLVITWMLMGGLREADQTLNIIKGIS